MFEVETTNQWMLWALALLFFVSFFFAASGFAKAVPKKRAPNRQKML